MCRRTSVWTTEAGLTMDPGTQKLVETRGLQGKCFLSYRGRKQPEWSVPVITSKRPHWLREGALGKLVLASSTPRPPFTMTKLLYEGSGPR